MYYLFLPLKFLCDVDTDDSKHHDDQTHRENNRLYQTDGDTIRETPRTCKTKKMSNKQTKIIKRP